MEFEWLISSSGEVIEFLKNVKSHRKVVENENTLEK